MTEIIKREMNLILVPAPLVKIFENEVWDTYKSGYLDLHHIAFVLDKYCVHAWSYEETGDPFCLYDDPTLKEEDFADIKQSSFNELMSDVYEVLKFFNMFHAWNDLKDFSGYNLVDIRNPPVKEVW